LQDARAGKARFLPENASERKRVLSARENTFDLYPNSGRFKTRQLPALVCPHITCVVSLLLMLLERSLSLYYTFAPQRIQRQLRLRGGDALSGGSPSLNSLTRERVRLRGGEHVRECLVLERTRVDSLKRQGGGGVHALPLDNALQALQQVHQELQQEPLVKALPLDDSLKALVEGEPQAHDAAREHKHQESIYIYTHTHTTRKHACARKYPASIACRNSMY
jgi:hypothetical protein